MDCPVCKRKVPSSLFESHLSGDRYWEKNHVCKCGYEEFTTSYGAHSVTVEGVEYVCGDPTTIAGSLMAWNIWFAILRAREALSNGDIHNE